MYIMALDDPLIGLEGIAYEQCMANHNVMLGITQRGGHLGHFESFLDNKQWVH